MCGTCLCLCMEVKPQGCAVLAETGKWRQILRVQSLHFCSSSDWSVYVWCCCENWTHWNGPLCAVSAFLTFLINHMTSCVLQTNSDLWLQCQASVFYIQSHAEVSSETLCNHSEWWSADNSEYNTCQSRQRNSSACASVSTRCHWAVCCKPPHTRRCLPLGTLSWLTVGRSLHSSCSGFIGWRLSKRTLVRCSLVIRSWFPEHQSLSTVKSYIRCVINLSGRSMQRARPPLARSDCSNESKLDCSLGGGADCITVGKDKAAPYKSVSHKNSLPNSVLTLFHQLSYEPSGSVCVPVHAEDVRVLADFNLFVGLASFSVSFYATFHGHKPAAATWDSHQCNRQWPFRVYAAPHSALKAHHHPSSCSVAPWAQKWRVNAKIAVPLLATGGSKNDSVSIGPHRLSC